LRMVAISGLFADSISAIAGTRRGPAADRAHQRATGAIRATPGPGSEQLTDGCGRLASGSGSARCISSTRARPSRTLRQMNGAGCKSG
jgi:hypothetical protein